MNVLPPDIVVAPLGIDLGDLDRETCTTADLTMTNSGDGTLVFEIVTRGSGDLTVAPSLGSVSPDGTVILVLTICAGDRAPGDYQAEVVINSNDPDEAAVVVTVSFSVPAPDIVVNPALFDVTRDRDELTLTELTIGNVGAGSLFFDISITDTTPQPAVARVTSKQKESLPMAPTSEQAPVTAALDKLTVHPLQGAEFLVIDHGRDKSAFAGHTYDAISDTTFGALPLAQMLEYDVVYFEPSWGDYNSLRANMDALRQYVEQGGVAVINIAGNSGSQNDIDPMGTDYDRGITHEAEQILLPEHQYITGEPYGGAPLTVADFNSWGSTDHGWLTNFPAGSDVVLQNTDGASWLQYRLGRGEVIITTLTYGWGGGGARGNPLTNLAEYSLALPLGVSWITVEPLTELVQPDGSIGLVVTFDSTDLDPGTYTADIVVASNDPDENPTTVMATLTVLPPDIQVSSQSISVFMGPDQAATETLNIGNAGPGTLVFDLVVEELGLVTSMGGPTTPLNIDSLVKSLCRSN